MLPEHGLYLTQLDAMTAKFHLLIGAS